MWVPTFDRRHLYLFDRVREMGFDGLELVLVGDIARNLPVKEMKEASERTGVQCTFCASVSPADNVAGPDPKARQRGLDHLKWAVDTAAELGSDFIAGLPYAAWGYLSGKPPTPDERRWSQDCVRELCHHAQGCGVKIAIEPVSRFECYLLATAQDALQYCYEVGEPNLGLHLDTFQMNIEEKNLAAAIRLTEDRLFHFHMCASDRGVPGEDHVPWPEVLGALKEIGYDRWVTIESFSPEPGGPGANAAIWRRLAPSGDAIAEGGLRLLREYLR